MCIRDRVADWHLGYNIGEGQMRRMVEKINAADVDLVCVAGDMFDNEYEAVLSLIHI